MFPMNNPVRTLDKVVNHYRDRRIVLSPNRRSINPGSDLRFKPVFDCIRVVVEKGMVW